MKTFFRPLRQRFTQFAKPLRIVCYLLLIYGLYLILLGLITPHILNAQLPRLLNNQIGRQSTIQRIRINPFLSRIQLDEVAILDAKTSAPFFSFHQLDIEINLWQSLFTLTPTLDHIYLDHPALSVTRYDDTNRSFSFDDIISQIDTNSTKPSEAKESTELPAFRIHKIRLNQGIFNFSDEPLQAHLNYENLNFTVTDLDSKALILTSDTSTPKAGKQTRLTNHYAIHVHDNDQSQLQLSGQFQLQPLKVEGDFSIKNQSLHTLWPYAKPFTKAKLNSGTVSLATHYKLAQEQRQFTATTTNGRLSLHNIRLTNSEGATVIHVPSFDIAKVSANTHTQHIDVGSVVLDKFWLNGKLSERGLDLQSLFTTPNGKTSSDKTISLSTTTTKTTAPSNSHDAAQPAWYATIHQLAIHDADINIQDNLVSAGVYWRLAPITLTTQTIDSRLTQPINYQLAIGLASHTKTPPSKTTHQGSFISSGNIDGKTLTIDSQIALKSFDLVQIAPYLTPYINVILNQGTVSADGQFNRSADGNITLTTKMDINKLSIQDQIQKQPLIKWQAMSIDQLVYQQQPQSLTINTVALDKPFTRILISKDKTTNIDHLVNSVQTKNDNKTPSTVHRTKTPAPHNQQPSPLAISIKKIIIRNGDAYFSDQSLTPSFASGIEKLNGSITNLSSAPRTTAKVAIKGQIDQYAPMTLKGRMNPLLKQPYLDLNLAFSNVELTSVNPYSGTYAGYYIDKGQLSSEFNYTLRNGQLIGKNHVVIDQLTLGKASNSKLATRLPVKLAIALLQDRNGVIDLGVDVSGNVNDPSFSVGGIILKAFVNIVTKAVTAPFSLLADLVSSDDELDDIAFPPGSAVLTETQQSRLNQLANGLSDRPQLKVSIKGDVLPKDDHYALAQHAVQQQLLKMSELASLPQNFSASQIPQSGPLADALETLYEQTFNQDVSAQREQVKKDLAHSADMAQHPTEQQITTVLYMGLYNQLISSQAINNQALGALAQSRAQAVKHYLVNIKAIDPGRIFLIDSQTNPENKASHVALTLTVD